MLDEKDLQAIAGLMEAQEKRINEQTESSMVKHEKRILEEFNAVIEDKVSHEIKVIAEGHADIMDRLPRVNEVEDLKSRIRVLERIVKEHSKTIDELRKAQ